MSDKGGGPGSTGARTTVAPALATSAALASTGGALVALQILFNGALGASGSGPVLASLLSYIGTLISAIAVILVIGRATQVFRTIRHKSRPWWFAVGINGVPIVISTAWGAPVLGVAISAICSIGGQTIAGLLLDSRGIGVRERIPLTPRRIVAGIIAIGGLALALGPGLRDLPDPLTTALLGASIFVSGMLLAVQNAGNGAVAGLSGNAFVPMVTSAIGGTITISVLVLALWVMNLVPDRLFPPQSEWWMYLGGPVGMGIVLCATMAVRTLGTFGLTLLMVVGQMVTAMLIDLMIDGVMDWTALGASVAMVIAILVAVQPRKDSGARHPASPAV